MSLIIFRFKVMLKLIANNIDEYSCKLVRCSKSESWKDIHFESQ